MHGRIVHRSHSADTHNDDNFFSPNILLHPYQAPTQASEGLDHRKDSACAFPLRILHYIKCFLNRYRNSYILGKLISSTVQLICMYLILFTIKTIIEVDDYGQIREQHEKLNEEQVKKCRNFKNQVNQPLHFLCISMVLGLPATGWRIFQLYRQPNGGESSPCSLQRTTFLCFCELLVIAQLPLLGHASYEILARLTEDVENLYCFRSYDNWLILLIVLQRLMRYYVYFLCYFQVLSFNRCRDQLLRQRGAIPLLRLFQPKKYVSSNRADPRALVKQELHAAALSGDIIMLKKCCERAIALDGPEFSKKWYKCRYRWWFTWSAKNPLHLACIAENLGAVRVLLENGFNANQRDKVIWTSISLQELYNLIFRLLPFLRDSDQDAKGRGYKFGQEDFYISTLISPLHIAASLGSLDLVHLLIDHGADTNLAAVSNLKRERTPPLFWANSADTVDALIRGGANHLHVPPSSFRLTAYQHALVQNRVEVSNTLEKWGGDVVLSPLHTAAANGEADKVKRLLYVGTDPNVLGEQSEGLFSRTPLHWACMRGNVEVVKLLLKFKANIEAKDRKGRTPLAWAVYHNRVDTVVQMLAQGANPNCIDNSGLTCTGFGAQAEGIQDTIFRELIVHGADINAPNRVGDTPLHIAIKMGNRLSATSLIRCGSDVMRINAEGLRAVDCTSSSELQYAIKKEAGSRDVMISYTHKHSEFTTKIRDTLEANHITTWFDDMTPTGIGGGAVWREEIARGITNASVVLCVLSKDYPKSQWCMKELAFAKQMGVPVMGLVCEDVEFSDELQVYLFTRQLVDFRVSITQSNVNPEGSVFYQYDGKKFDEQMHSLLDGLRDEIEKRRVASADFQTEHVRASEVGSCCSGAYAPTNSTLIIKPRIFITHGDCHTTFGRRLRASLEENGFSCHLDSRSANSSTADRVRYTNDAILSCSVFVVILSNVSAMNTFLSDQLAFAEDRGKRIVPIFLSSPYLDLSLQYSLSRDRIFHFSENIGYKDSLELLLPSLHEVEAPIISPVATPHIINPSPQTPIVHQ